MSEGNHSDVPESGTNVNELEVKRNINETNLIASQLNNAAANECAANEVITNKSVYDAPDAANEGAANQVITNQSVYGAPDTDIVEASKQKSENPIKANLVCETTNDAIIMIDRALCANYRSDSESDSVDSEPDSSTSSSISSSDIEDDSTNFQKIKNKNREISGSVQTDFFPCDLPSIEDLKISLPEESCVEIGVITSVVDTLVVVESYKGTAALDVDTILFLDHGKRPLGRVFETLGPISEPVYVVRFNNTDEITRNTIVKGEKVYYGPQTEHTKFVFLSEVMKCRGSDASWKDNIEAPSEFQDFSDDEEENLFKKKNEKLSSSKTCDEISSRKRALNNQLDTVVRPCKFKSENRRKNFNTNPNFAPRERFRFCQPKNSFPPVPIPPHQAFGLPQNACPYPRPRNVMNFFPPTTYPYISSPSPRFSFSSYENFPFSNISQGVRPEFLFQQRAQLLPENFSMHWPMVSPPPPPPPPPPLPPPLALMQDNREVSEVDSDSRIKKSTM